jgi:hypothetical protein
MRDLALVMPGFGTLNYMEPDGWFTLAFTGSGAEALGTGWQMPIEFIPTVPSSGAPLTRWAESNIPGAVPLCTLTDGNAIHSNRQLVRAPFTCPAIDAGVSVDVQLVIYARGMLQVVKLNEHDTGLGVAPEPNSVGTVMSGQIDPALLNFDADNLLAVEYRNVPTGPAAARAQFIAYQIVITT